VSERGFLLAEVSVAYLIMALAICALVPCFIMAIRANNNTQKIQTATNLSVELMEEVRMRKWDQNTPSNYLHISSGTATLGIDAGETATDKTTFNDIDDFNGYTETGVKDPMGNAVSQFSQYNRSVVVQYTDSSYNVQAATSDYKMITVCTYAVNLSSICLVSVMDNR
jgi:Tfp pilus assembly protein PilV